MCVFSFRKSEMFQADAKYNYSNAILITVRPILWKKIIEKSAVFLEANKNKWVEEVFARKVFIGVEKLICPQKAFFVDEILFSDWAFWTIL